MPECINCHASLPESEFYKHPAMRAGILGKCKGCCKAHARANRRAKQEYYLEYDRKRGSRQSRSYVKEYRRENPEKYKAHTAVGNAVKSGLLVREPCFMCGNEKVEAHHPDYSKPLSVVWLCPKCHKRYHALENKCAEIRSA